VSIKLFQIVRNKSSVSASVSGGEDNENQKDKENTSNKQQSEDKAGNEKESEEESQNANSSGDDNEIEILSSCDSQESFTERLNSPAVSVKDEQSVPFNTVVDLKTEEIVPQTPVKKEYKIQIKSLKEELLKEGELELEVDKLDIDESAQVSDAQNGVAKKEETEHKSERQQFIVVRSDLLYNNTVDQSNMPPVQIEEPPSYSSQNGAPLTYVNMLCDVCGLQFDSSELLTEHKVAMKHFKCTFKDCEILVLSSQQELLDHQHLIHNILPSPVQQLAHQVIIKF